MTFDPVRKKRCAVLIAWLLIAACMSGCAGTAETKAPASVPAAEAVPTAKPESPIVFEQEEAPTASAEPEATALPAESEPTPEPTPEATPEPAAEQPAFPTGPSADYDHEYYIYVEKGNFTLTVWQRDENGKYSDMVICTRVAHGGNRTPNGQHPIKWREEWKEFTAGGFAPWACRYAGVYLHAPTCKKKDRATMSRFFYDGDKAIGTVSTAGCIRMVTSAAKFIYDNCDDGTIIEIVNDAPLGFMSEAPPELVYPSIDPTDTEMMELQRQKDAAAQEKAGN